MNEIIELFKGVGEYFMEDMGFAITTIAFVTIFILGALLMHWLNKYEKLFNENKQLRAQINNERIGAN